MYRWDAYRVSCQSWRRWHEGVQTWCHPCTVLYCFYSYIFYIRGLWILTISFGSGSEFHHLYNPNPNIVNSFCSSKSKKHRNYRFWINFKKCFIIESILTEQTGYKKNYWLQKFLKLTPDPGWGSATMIPQIRKFINTPIGCVQLCSCNLNICRLK